MAISNSTLHGIHVISTMFPDISFNVRLCHPLQAINVYQSVRTANRHTPETEILILHRRMIFTDFVSLANVLDENNWIKIVNIQNV